MLPFKCASPLFISVGEPSGDLYASHLIRMIRAEHPSLDISGIGGANMAANNIDIIMDYEKMMTLGFASGVLSAGRNYRVFKKIARKLNKIRPRTFVAVAYPGVNLLLCRYAHNLGARVYYYLPPQIWAWGSFRKYFIKQWVDEVISVFPFERKFYERMGITTVLLKNPLFAALEKYQRRDFRPRIGIMPGSRSTEIERNLPVIIELMQKIREENKHIEFVLILHPSSIETVTEFLSRKLSYTALGFSIAAQDRYQAMKDSDLLIICSGTASLEAAAMKIPQIFFNLPSFVDYFLIRRFIRIKEYNLTNLYFDRPMVPAYVSRDRAGLVQQVFGQIPDTFLIDG
jgi:lipid-A-disaccharide synthase